MGFVGYESGFDGVEMKLVAATRCLEKITESMRSAEIPEGSSNTYGNGDDEALGNVAAALALDLVSSRYR